VQAELDGATVSGTALRDYLHENHPQPELNEPLLFDTDGVRREFFYSGNMVSFAITRPGMWNYETKLLEPFEG